MLKAARKTGLVFFPAFDWAIDPTHPEREERLLYTQDQVFEEGLLDVDGIIELKPDRAAVDDVQRVHFCVPHVLSVTTDSHLISAGGAKTVGKALLEKKIERGFALVRPPGHHAGRIVHGARGFCNINIEAVMIEYLRETYDIDKVAVIDTDCHHGDGTQDIYWHDPDTLFISIHQDGRTLYPGSGFIEEQGGPNAQGMTVNIPLPPYTSDEGYLYVMNHVVLPIIEDFKPDLVVNSAGQDNHFSDPITNMNFSARGYADLTTLLQPDIAVLEGGYSIEGALPYVNLGIILAMAGMDYHMVREPGFDPEKIRQKKETDRYIKDICEQVLSSRRKMNFGQNRSAPSGEFRQRQRRIAYDTDNIIENQRESIRLCKDCGGVLRIDSKSSKNKDIQAVHIPRKSCNACRDVGYRWFDQADKKEKDHIFLQDRTEDLYLEKGV